MYCNTDACFFLILPLYQCWPLYSSFTLVYVQKNPVQSGVLVTHGTFHPLWFLHYRLYPLESLGGPPGALEEPPPSLPTLGVTLLTFLVSVCVPKFVLTLLVHFRLIILDFLLFLSLLLKLRLIVLYYLYCWLVLGDYRYPFTSHLCYSLVRSLQIIEFTFALKLFNIINERFLNQSDYLHTTTCCLFQPSQVPDVLFP